MPILKETTFFKDIVVEPNRKIDVEIGDSKQTEFYPQFKTKHWDNECNFSVRLSEDIAGATVKTIGDKIIWAKSNIEAHFYQVRGFENGGFEFEIPLLDKNELLYYF